MEKLELSFAYIKASAKAEQKLKVMHGIYLKGNEIQTILSKHFNLQDSDDIIYKKLNSQEIFDIIMINHTQ